MEEILHKVDVDGAYDIEEMERITANGLVQRKWRNRQGIEEMNGVIDAIEERVDGVAERIDRIDGVCAATVDVDHGLD